YLVKRSLWGPRFFRHVSLPGAWAIAFALFSMAGEPVKSIGGARNRTHPSQNLCPRRGRCHAPPQRPPTRARRRGTGPRDADPVPRSWVSAVDHLRLGDGLEALHPELQPVSGLLRAAEGDRRVDAPVAVDPHGSRLDPSRDL